MTGSGIAAQPSQPVAPRIRRDSVYRRLVAADTKDLARTLQTGFASLFLFVFFLALIAVLGFLLSSSGSTPKIAVVSADAAFVATLESALDDALDDGGTIADPDAATLFIVQEGDRVEIIVDAETNPAWHEAWRVVRSTGVAASDISVSDTDGIWRADILQQNLAPAIGMGLMAIAFVGTAVPLVSMRERGMLRLLGTTPLRTSIFIMSLVPARLAVVVVEIAMVLVIAVSRSYTDIGMLWRLTISSGLGMTMLFALAFLFAARSRSAANMQQWMVALTMLLVGVGGGVLPPQTIPVPLHSVFATLPTTWMIEAISTDLTGIEPDVSIYALWAMMAGCAVVALVIAARTFSWDREPRTTGKASEDA